jgi:hypothetical protein
MRRGGGAEGGSPGKYCPPIRKAGFFIPLEAAHRF